MPKKSKLYFICENFIVHYCLLPEKGLFLARLRRGGYNVIVYSKNFEEMKKKFIFEFNRQTAGLPDQTCRTEHHNNCEILFGAYGEQWLETKRQMVKPSTFKEYERTYHRDVVTLYGELKLKEITRAMLQNDLLRIFDTTPKKAEKMHLMLSCIFNMAEEDYQIRNPMKKVVLPFREAKKGSALTKSEERILTDYCVSKPGLKASSALLILYLFGLRTSELKTLKVLDDKWIEVITSKELLGKNEVRRKIPVTAFARRYLQYIDFEVAKNTIPKTITSAIARIFPKDKVKPHHPHELRYTFITRCKECGVNPELVMLWDGHEEDKDVKSSKVDRGYTDYSEEYQLEQAQLVDYEI